MCSLEKAGKFSRSARKIASSSTDVMETQQYRALPEGNCGKAQQNKSAGLKYQLYWK